MVSASDVRGDSDGDPGVRGCSDVDTDLNGGFDVDWGVWGDPVGDTDVRDVREDIDGNPDVSGDSDVREDSDGYLMPGRTLVGNVSGAMMGIFSAHEYL